jgi:hypothetical protein
MRLAYSIYQMGTGLGQGKACGVPEYKRGRYGGRTASDLALHIINETAGRFKPRTTTLESIYLALSIAPLQ